MNSARDYGFYTPNPEAKPRNEGRLRLIAGTVAVAFAVTLAVVIGQRLSDQAISVLAGAVCGVAASIPTSLLIVWVTRRREETSRAHTPQQGTYPAVLVIQPPAQGQHQGMLQPPLYGPYTAPAPREFTVVGEEGEKSW